MLSGFLGFVWERCVSTVPCGWVRWGMTYPTLCGVHIMNHCLEQSWKAVHSCFSISMWIRKSHIVHSLWLSSYFWSRVYAYLICQKGVCITCQRWDRLPLFFQEWWVLQGPRNDNFVIISDPWGQRRWLWKYPSQSLCPGFCLSRCP